ncbi:glycine betaine/L-proline ABC transporter [Dinoroseobacter shibae DFL 12 = DSM 16493]|jgi:glycine betaine/proline transport system ATP-binding protein|uniref:Quaternary amine transport ATP-binding protein n=1 Tax=Dinoroseobacter shibae (strain DSM 16493 / NCIMB 14021 / DFL 12) TaxID=398580 RepID=A8LJF7_DINSH|nr:betaine/proline/choline family ABC transporter ATP-binding protein [Dinoroseobacter shibae]ABV93179.1 glycine betaine/L-proline ABC transporter [Dinoroseobacter shibae DFL 12 = DSM 16493]URF48105.1 betaine/proline/choline family ABC transporter ATP-binding protein [Dinoroseobacter shibae]URF52415.1 betaine/proline/choline family ABC transporter ATP-binding protein [Dinoroseobacter shibae]
MHGDTVIEISNVWKIFGANAQAALEAVRDRGLSKAEILAEFNAVVGVADVSLSVRRGEIFCIMGLSGSGKSTLVRHFNRLLEPTAGRIEIEGTDVMALGTQELQRFRNRQIGMVFQNFALMPHRSVLDNVAMPLEIRKVPKNERMRQAAAILDIVELGAWGAKFAHELPGGMQQRVGLARALAANPDVLLMDEPFSALDPLIRRQLQDEFIRLSKILKKTTIFITHDLDEAVRIGDRIAIMRDGKVVQMGTAEDIVMHPADDYVADFVAGISRLKVVHAHAVMQPLEAYLATHGPLPAAVPKVDEGETLSNLITLAIDDENPILVQDAGRDVGIITRADLLRTVIEGTEVS